MSETVKDTSKHGTAGFVNGVPANWTPTPSEPVPVIQCTATAKSTGEQCRRPTLRGARVCVKHGAQLPNVRAHAEAVVEAGRLRLMSNVDMAIDALERLMLPGTAEAIVLKAATETLDRAGLKNAIDINVEVTNHGPDPAAQVRERLARLNPALTASPDEEIQDAEIVEDTLF